MNLNTRKIRSFVRREGRMTKAQDDALKRLWPQYGLDYTHGMIVPEKLFKRDAPLVLEIGTGMGEALLNYAENEPGKNFIGIEVHRPGIGALLHQIEKRHLNNIRLYQDDAVEVLNDCIPDQSLTRVQLFFPDPWHKKRHHKRRIVQPDFVALLVKKLKVGGVIHMATDWAPYAEQMLSVLSDNAELKNLADDGAYVARPDHRLLTRFEQRGIQLGHSVFDLMFCKL